MHGCRCQGNLLCYFCFIDLDFFYMQQFNALNVFTCVYTFSSELHSLHCIKPQISDGGGYD